VLNINRLNAEALSHAGAGSTSSYWNIARLPNRIRGYIGRAIHDPADQGEIIPQERDALRQLTVEFQQYINRSTGPKSPDLGVLHLRKPQDGRCVFRRRRHAQSLHCQFAHVVADHGVT
jgi:hypothetical protein